MMALPPVGTSSPATPAAENKPEAHVESPEANRQASRKRQNLAILEANREVSLSAGSQPLTLAFQAAIDAINRQLEPAFGENALERGRDEGLDVSPEATAERIVSLTTGLFTRFQQHRPDLSEPEQVERFLELISAGIDQGFAEAREILDGLQVLEGEIAENIDRTYELVQQGLQAFRERFGLAADEDAATGDSSSTADG